LAAPPLFRVRVRRQPDGLVAVECDGELDVASADELRETFAAARATGASALRLDLRGIVFFDSSGVRCILDCYRSCEDAGIDFEIAPSRQVARVLELVDFSESTAARVLEPATPGSAPDAGSREGLADRPGVE
jgi:anti-sigma B factor antagonist